jgi:hypothetical protein
MLEMMLGKGISGTKKPPSGGHDITAYCFDYSGIIFPGTRGGT